MTNFSLKTFSTFLLLSSLTGFAFAQDSSPIGGTLSAKGHYSDYKLYIVCSEAPSKDCQSFDIIQEDIDKVGLKKETYKKKMNSTPLSLEQLSKLDQIMAQGRKIVAKSGEGDLSDQTFSFFNKLNEVNGDMSVTGNLCNIVIGVHDLAEESPVPRVITYPSIIALTAGAVGVGVTADIIRLTAIPALDVAALPAKVVARKVRAKNDQKLIENISGTSESKNLELKTDRYYRVVASLENGLKEISKK